jgi:hypothetical protein
MVRVQRPGWLSLRLAVAAVLIGALVLAIGVALRAAGLSVAANVAQIISLAPFIGGLIAWSRGHRRPAADRTMPLGELLRTIADAHGLTGEDLRTQLQSYEGDLVDAYLDGTQQPNWDFVSAFLDVVAGDDRWQREVLERRIRAVWRMPAKNSPSASRERGTPRSAVAAETPVGNAEPQITDEDIDGANSDFQSNAPCQGDSASDLPVTRFPPGELKADGQEVIAEDEIAAHKGASGRPLKILAAIGILVAASALAITVIQINLDSGSGRGSSKYYASTPGPGASSLRSPSVSDWPYKQWVGDLLLSGGRVNLSSVPPNVNDNSGDEDLSLSEGLISPFGVPMAVWSGKGVPTAKACATLVITEGVNSVQPEPGMAICVKTTQDDIAALVVKKNTLDTSGTATSTLVQATVWSSRNTKPSAPGSWPHVRWVGDLLLSGGRVNLSSVPPNVNDNSGDEDLSLSEGLISPFGVPMAVWSGKGVPTAKACATLVITEGVNSVQPEPGMAICVKTTQDDIAALVIKKNTLDTSGTATSTLAQTTVWSK